LQEAASQFPTFGGKVMATESVFVLKFPGLSASDANKLTKDLEADLLRAGITANRKRENEDSQDFGATLVLVLGAPAVVVASKALLAWVQRKNATSLRIEDASGQLIADNLESKDAPALAEAFARRIPPG